ncbi:MAG TPA: hypothetical protein VLA66_03405 [Thermoanaerobaculia bacterium]|nr:hypothetical protein [Thermoanaerobaculia bacterium]
MSVGPAGVVELARRGRLYPSLIVHGGDVERRREAALELARTLLCEREDPAQRPCAGCRHCRRIAWPGTDAPFHPDFAVLERDLRTSTSAQAARELLRAAQSSPFEARGQVFVVAEADTLSPEAGDALLKQLEEPGLKAPRHFLLLAPGRIDLPETLRSRSLAVYLGAPEAPPEGEVEALANALVEGVRRGGGALLSRLDLAGRLAGVEGFEDPRAAAPWILGAAALRLAALDERTPPALRRPLLALAEDLLAAPPMRLRGISPERIVEGLVARHLAPALSS